MKHAARQSTEPAILSATAPSSGMTAERLEQCERLASEWSMRDMLTGSVDAQAASGFVAELCAEVRRLRARNAVLEPRCDVCGLALVGFHATRVVVARDDKNGVEYTLGACCEDKPFKVPAGARRVALRTGAQE